jgi:hypothetical protein
VALRALAVLLIAVQVDGGFRNGREDASASRAVYQTADLVAAHAACAQDASMESALFPNSAYNKNSNVRALAIAAKANHLSFFGTSEASKFEHMKLPHAARAQPQSSVLKPTSGELLRGNVFLVANASGKCFVNAVNFQIVDSGGQHPEVVHAERFLYGWLGGWSTKDVPNGRYTVQSTVRDIMGDTATSRTVSVTVQN